MDTVDVERLGGFAGFGLPGSRLRSRGQIDAARLPTNDRQALEALFARRGPPGPALPDSFRYRITRRIGGRAQTVEVPEQDVPAPLRDCVHDDLE